MDSSKKALSAIATAVLLGIGCGSDGGPGVSGSDVLSDILLHDEGAVSLDPGPGPDDVEEDDVATIGDADVVNDVHQPDNPDVPPMDDVQDAYHDGLDDNGVGDAGGDARDVIVDTQPDDSTDDIDVPPALPEPCDPCETDEDCEGIGLCMELGLSVFVCGVFCGPDNQCPYTYLCEVATTSEGTMAAQCIPADICPCNDTLEGVTNSCKQTTIFGVCHGVETCDDGVWTECDAPEPAEEECNGKDDDCNGETDEGFGTITCGLGICEHTISACDESGGTAECDPMEGALDQDLPDTDGVDTDCDGIDGTEAFSIFVSSTTGLDTNPGTRDKPKKTLTAGIEEAGQSGMRDVLVSEGMYLETPEFVAGVNVHGGYRAYEGWKRYKTSKADIHGGAVGAMADKIDLPTVVTRLRIKAADGTEPGQHSIGLWVSDSSSDLDFQECEIRAGWGASGKDGDNAPVAASGGNGGKGGDGCENAGWPCGQCSMPGVGTAGSSDCGMDGGLGGNPGHGGGSGSKGGDGCCTTSGGDGGPSETSGDKGDDGLSGDDGENGEGGDGLIWITAQGLEGTAGEPGESGEHGDGGGGGGGGGGGCGGEAGQGGQAGGSSIAVVSIDSEVQINDCWLRTDGGGIGGSGGLGALGASGGLGSSGGGGHEDSGKGGKGGNGGIGGDGGHGGGGSGGADIGVLCGGDVNPALAGCTFKLGFGGTGGAGPGNAGAVGKVAEAMACGY